jgi:hypothetical protein
VKGDSLVWFDLLPFVFFFLEKTLKHSPAMPRYFATIASIYLRELGRVNLTLGKVNYSDERLSAVLQQFLLLSAAGRLRCVPSEPDYSDLMIAPLSEQRRLTECFKSLCS